MLYHLFITVCKPINITVVQIYAPTSSAEEEDSDAFYDNVQSVLDQITNGDILYIIGDWNAKVGKEWHRWKESIKPEICG